MRRRLSIILVALTAVFGMFTQAAGPAYANHVTLHDTAVNSAEFCYVTCTNGRVATTTWIRQARLVSNPGVVVGTKTYCQARPYVGVASVRVVRCAEGIVGGVALAVNNTDTPGGNVLQLTASNPTDYYEDTQHLSDWGGFDIRGVQTTDIRWSNQVLTQGLVTYSLISRDFDCPTGTSSSPCTSTYVEQL